MTFYLEYRSLNVNLRSPSCSGGPVFIEQTMPAVMASFAASSRLRELLSLLGALREVREPLSSPEGLRASLAWLLRVAEFAGAEPAWTQRVRLVLEDPRAFEVVLAIVRYLHALVSGDEATEDAESAAARSASAAESAGGNLQDGSPAKPDHVSAQAFFDWLPLVLELMAVLRDLRRLLPIDG